MREFERSGEISSQEVARRTGAVGKRCGMRTEASNMNIPQLDALLRFALMSGIPLVRLACALFAVAACSDSISPPQQVPPALQIITRPSARDTIGARPAQALIVEVRDTLGVVQPGLTIRFQGLPHTWTEAQGQQAYTMVVSRIDEDTFVPLISDTTDSKGRAAALIAFGGAAGPGGVIVTVPELGLADTVDFTKDPGQLAHLRLFPTDTTVLTGGAIIRPLLWLLDRNFNPREDDVALTSPSTLLNPAPGGGFRSGDGTGLAMIIGSVNALADTVMVSIVPEGILAAYQYGGTSSGIVVVNTDGSERRFLTSALGHDQMGAPEWSSDGQSVFHRRAVSGVSYLNRTALAGDSQSLVPPGVSDPGWPSVSKDGQWVYFSAGNGSTQAIWRMQADGAQLEAMSAPGAGLESRPDISRNGNLLAFVGPGPTISVRDLSTGSMTMTGVPGQSPSFSPIDDRIAFLPASGTGDIAVMNHDGTNIQYLTTTSDFWESLDWSPDGKWIISTRNAELALIEVSTGLVLPLPWSRFLRHPAWRP